jgi:hypothetical protein
LYRFLLPFRLWNSFCVCFLSDFLVLIIAGGGVYWDLMAFSLARTAGWTKSPRIRGLRDGTKDRGHVIHQNTTQHGWQNKRQVKTLLTRLAQDIFSRVEHFSRGRDDADATGDLVFWRRLNGCI